jgi:hypothetical protein
MSPGISIPERCPEGQKLGVAVEGYGVVASEATVQGVACRSWDIDEHLDIGANGCMYAFPARVLIG